MPSASRLSADVGRALRDHRERAGISQARLAALLTLTTGKRVTATTVLRLEGGQSTITMDYLAAVVALLPGVTVQGVLAPFVPAATTAVDVDPDDPALPAQGVDYPLGYPMSLEDLHNQTRADEVARLVDGVTPDEVLARARIAYPSMSLARVISARYADRVFLHDLQGGDDDAKQRRAHLMHALKSVAHDIASTPDGAIES